MRTPLLLTEHAVTRMSQRAITKDDLELVHLIGTEVEGGYLVREKDFRALEREIDRLRDRARRLVGKRLVVDGSLMVTVYHASRGKEKRLLRGANAKACRER